jgi:glucosylceramidase
MRRLGPRVRSFTAAVALAAIPLAGGASTTGAAVGTRPSPFEVEVVQTTQDLSQRMARLPDVALATTAPAAGIPVIHVNDRVGYQRITGVGAAMTDTSAWLIERQLPRARASALLADLFGPSGIHLGFLRVPIGASDFTHNGVPYSYDDLPRGQTDPHLAHFSIAHDKAYILPALRQALAENHSLEVLANPWSPPGWMKANDALDNEGHAGTLLPSAYKPLAQYFVKFLKAYAAAGVPVQAITPENEPDQPTIYPGMQLTEPDEATFVADDLAPALRTAGLHQKIYGHDLGWSAGSRPYAGKLATSAAARDLAGIAWHCYFGGPGVMSALHARVPRLDDIMDECSTGITPYPVSEVMLASIRDWASAVALWNLALDVDGGPVQPPNDGCPGCTGVVTINRRSHTVSLGLTYYQLGQLSAFVQSGARRVSSNNFVTYDYKRPGVNIVSPGLDDVAFVNPDGSRVLVAYNNSAAVQTFAVQWDGRSFTYSLPAEAMVTFNWDRP